MKITCAGIVTSILLVEIGAQASLAQSGIKEDTLDTHVARSDRIVRATVADVSFEQVDDRPTKGWIRTVVTLKVVETIKGPPAETLTFGLGGYHVDQRYEGWKEAGTENLWFLGRNPIFGKKENFGEDEIYARFPLNLHYRISLGPAIASEKLYGPSRPRFLP